MIKKTALFILLLCIHSIILSQTNDSSKTEKVKKGIVNNWYIETGGIYSSFQDTKFSNVQYSGFGAVIRVGYNREKTNKYFMETAISFQFSKENAKTHDNGGAMIFYPNIYFKYLRVLNNHFLIGGRADVFDLNIRAVSGLQNNSGQYIASNNLYGSFVFKNPINDNWRFSAALDLALIGIQKDVPSFAMNYSQKRIEEGEVDYQDSSLGEPYPYHYWEFCSVFSSFNIKTALSFQYKSRITLSYNWEMRHWATIKSYPTTIGVHSIVFRYNFIHSLK